MRKITEQNLMSAFAGESQAHMRYVIFSDKAKEEGFPNVGRLFRAIYYAERVHAGNHFENLSHLKGGFVTVSMAGFGPGVTSKNLEIAIDGETFEIEEMYPVYLNTAKFQGEREAEKSFNFAYQAEKTHVEFFKRAKKAVDAGKDVELGDVQVCEVCGYTIEGEAPDYCPICGAAKNRFRTFKTEKK
ncbi:MAG: rubrerythrin family protein [Candidatus Hadarchaeaceae archaeon]